MHTRRRILQGGGLWLAALALPGRGWSSEGADTVEIRMRSDPDGARVWFDPVGLLIRPGQTVRWINDSAGNPHTSTAYHPANEGRPLRIPDGAEPWNSGYLIDPGDSFEVRLTREGTYDYFCVPHEAAGMVGRIVVGRPGGPGARPFQASVPEPARRAFPAASRIMAQGAVRPG